VQHDQHLQRAHGIPAEGRKELLWIATSLDCVWSSTTDGTWVSSPATAA
jgi:hypothetical protein